MENANKFLKDFASGISKGVNVAKLGKVVKFYPEVMKADVMPLPSEDNAMIINVPVATVRTSDFLLYYPLKDWREDLWKLTISISPMAKNQS